jgi:hypothetical protein|tara:strand:- start:1316 stop:1744 length:429 start_codon:yes stop_codon:yes gene_type:complete
MASVKATNITNLDASPSVLADASEVHGSVRVFKDTYEASSLASGSDITVARLPIGAKVVDIHVKADALGSNATLAVGNGTTADKYIAAAAMNTANKLISLSNDGKIEAIGDEITSTITNILVTTGGATTSGTITTVVYYTVS